MLVVILGKRIQMKKFAFLLILLLGLSCQKEELTVIEEQEEASFLEDGQLTNLIKSVASHDGSYDDLVDGSSCFSIDFPYDVMVNGKPYTINSITDLALLNKGDEIMPVFPIDITFANYIEADVPNVEVFQEFIDRCADGSLYNDRITCVDFVYPIDVSVYDPVNSDFGIISFQHDKQTFTEVEEMDPVMIASIRFPISLVLENGTRIQIADNQDLKSSILDLLPGCE
jgi:hypothetical protein